MASLAPPTKLEFQGVFPAQSPQFYSHYPDPANRATAV
jgi:hypothetical protein